MGKRCTDPVRCGGVQVAFGAQERNQEVEQAVVAGFTDEVSVDGAELLQIKPGRGLVDAFEAEQPDGFVLGEDFLVAMAPAEPQQVGFHAFGQVAEVAVDGRRQGAVALGEFAAIITVDHRQV